MTISRRELVQTAAVIGSSLAASGSAIAAADKSSFVQAISPASDDWRALDPKAPPSPKPDGIPSPTMRRWTDQRWILDNVIKSNGIEWDQPRMANLASALGSESGADIAGIRQRVQKFADIEPAFEAVARRREAEAIEAEKGENLTAARDNYFMASNYWGGAQWPLDENSEKNIILNEKKRETFLKYARLADHRIEPAWVPLGDKFLPGWFHLPYGYQSGRVPCVFSIPGMDGYKERSVALNSDRYLSRGIAVLVVEGPGQYEAPIYGVRVTVEGWQAAGKAIFGWLVARPEIDPQKVAITGSSFGSFFATIAAAAEPRYAAVAVSGTCLEPGCHTIFQEASPTFKRRFMYMSGITDEEKFDRFRQSLTWEGHIDSVKVPYLCIAGGSDELCPTEYTDRMMSELKSPKQLVIYADSRHSVGGVPSTNLGPMPSQFMAEWLAKRFAGQSFDSERWFVEATGRVVKSAYT
jgi:dienelactone hydrolase